MQSRRMVPLRRPEYTGSNRCIPCTVFNLGLVAAASVALAAWAEPVVGIGAAALGAGLVYVRGYVVPGTPALTERFLPDSVLARFEHGGPDDTRTEDRTHDPEETLRAVGALTPCAGRDDLCLDSLFRATWHAEMANTGDDDAALRALMPPAFDEPTYVERRGDAVVARTADTTVAEWPSRAAFVADAAGAAALRDVDAGWDERGFAERTQLLAGLRLWLDRCSVCGGRVELGEESVESCCRSVPVVAASCLSCGARIFEAPLPGE